MNGQSGLLVDNWCATTARVQGDGEALPQGAQDPCGAHSARRHRDPRLRGGAQEAARRRFARPPAADRVERDRDRGDAGGGIGQEAPQALSRFRSVDQTDAPGMRRPLSPPADMPSHWLLAAMGQKLPRADAANEVAIVRLSITSSARFEQRRAEYRGQAP